MVKARARRVGNLAILETELGQKAIVPWDSLCDLARKLDLTVEVNGVEVKCENLGGAVRTGGVKA